MPASSPQRLAATLLVALWLTAAAAAGADEAPWANFNADGMAAATAGDWAAAETAFRAALEALEEADGARPSPPDRVTDDDARIAVVAGNLAVVLLERGETAEARSLFERALAIRRAVLGTRDPAIAESLNNLAELERRTGNLARARTLHEAALELRREVRDEGHPDIAESLNNLGVLLRDQGELEAATAALGEAYALRRERLGEAHTLTLESAGNLAAVAIEEGDLATAEAVLRASIEATSKAGAEAGLPPYLLRSAVNVFLARDAVEDATLLCETHVLDAPPAGADMLTTAELVTACARTLGRVGREARATAMIERQLAAAAEAPPEVEAELRWGLAETATITGDLAAAEGHLDRVVELLHSTGDPRLPTALNNRGSLKFERGRPLEAAGDLETALELLNDPDRPDGSALLRDVLGNYAIVLRSLDRNADAVEVENRLLDLVTETDDLEIAPAAGD